MNRAEAHVFIATSLDGFIARPDGNLDWLMQAQATAPAGEDFGYAEFMAGIDALVMGRKTFETVLGFDPWPYPGRAVHVMSRSRAVRIPEALGPLVRETSQSPADLLQQLAQTGVRRACLDGGAALSLACGLRTATSAGFPDARSSGPQRRQASSAPVNPMASSDMTLCSMLWSATPLHPRVAGSEATTVPFTSRHLGSRANAADQFRNSHPER
jgi:dihydrofolate reductase